MTDSRAAFGTDRLPWLTDEPSPAQKRRARNDLLIWLVAAVIAVAGGAYWIGSRSGSGETEFAGFRSSQSPSTTVTMPEPSYAPEVQPAPAPEVNPPAVPEVRPVRDESVRITAPPDRRSIRRVLPIEQQTPAVTEQIERILKAQGAEQLAAPAPETVVKPAPKTAQSDKLKLWPATESAGATGRIVRIGAFGSRQQAKLGWRYMVEAYPAIAHLPATVVASDNSKGRHFYRFQIGTTSQAHSEVLCQRMEDIHFSCAVVGLPWKPTGVER
jgi:hypothetical protein